MIKRGLLIGGACVLAAITYRKIKLNKKLKQTEILGV